MNLLTGIGIFLAVLLLMEGSYALFRILTHPERRRVRRRLQSLSFDGSAYEPEGLALERKNLLSQVPWFNRQLLRLRWTPHLKSLIEQSGTPRPLGFFVLLSLVLPGVGLLVGFRLIPHVLMLLPFLALLATMPYVYLCTKKKRRIRKFESQLPEGMELMARALKAGHAFSGALKMVVDEMDDPIGEEFNKTLGEINFGVNVPEALKNLSRRVDSTDLRFFVISVIIQRETGGNLAEILDNIARLIRERFKLHGRIRVLSAEGRFSAAVLIGIPFMVAFILSLVNPNYIRTLITDPVGNILVALAIFLMILGVVVMKRMIVIKV
jgi:tight adherence protein B